MPVRNRRCIESIDEIDLDALAAANDESWVDVIATVVLCAIRDRTVHEAAWQRSGGGGDQRQRLAARRESSEIADVARDEQRSCLAFAGRTKIGGNGRIGLRRTEDRGETERADTLQKVAARSGRRNQRRET